MRDVNPKRLEEQDKGLLIVTYHGPDAFNVGTHTPLDADLVRPGTLHIVGTFSGIIGGMGVTLALRDGQTTSIPLLLGAYRCDGGPGSGIPSGTYGVRVEFGGEYGNPHVYLSDEASISIP
jgi:hypothetical protein